jgi:hypothetical protein
MLSCHAQCASAAISTLCAALFPTAEVISTAIVDCKGRIAAWQNEMLLVGRVALVCCCLYLIVLTSVYTLLWIQLISLEIS